MRFVEIPYGRGDVMCGTYSSINTGETNALCLDTADIGLAMIFTFAIFGFTDFTKKVFSFCFCRR